MLFEGDPLVGSDSGHDLPPNQGFQRWKSGERVLDRFGGKVLHKLQYFCHVEPGCQKQSQGSQKVGVQARQKWMAESNLPKV